jgi:hypothetical protein
MLPLLSPGKHRNPRKGACFMELASFLAGDRWCDRPACTHRMLAAVARYVNDCTTDAGRQRLATLIPSVIGLTSDDLRVDAQITLRCATTALPVVSYERQPAMAVAILTAERLLADLDGRPGEAMQERSERALADVPHAAQWAERFTDRRAPTPETFRRRNAPSVVSCAIIGIAQACTPDPDAILHDLLRGAIDDCREYAGQQTEQPMVRDPFGILSIRP